MDNTRNNFNKHLTNNVILRIDYVPIPDEHVDRINNSIAKCLLVDLEKFDSTTQTFMRNIDIQMNDPSIQDFNEFLNVKEKSKIKSYEYYKKDENNNIEMKVVFNRQFCSIDVNQVVKYCKFEEYRDIFLSILEIFKDNKIIINRFGLRKFNDFFVKHNANINEYVKNKYFNFECDDLLHNSDSFISEKRYTLASIDCKVNLITHSSIGTINNEFAKRIAFDIDVYIDEIKKLIVLETDGNKEYIDKINDIFFDIYIHLMEDKLIKILKKDNDLDDDNIICGVDYNE